MQHLDPIKYPNIQNINQIINDKFALKKIERKEY